MGLELEVPGESKACSLRISRCESLEYGSREVYWLMRRQRRGRPEGPGAGGPARRSGGVLGVQSLSEACCSAQRVEMSSSSEIVTKWHIPISDSRWLKRASSGGPGQGTPSSDSSLARRTSANPTSLHVEESFTHNKVPGGYVQISCRRVHCKHRPAALLQRTFRLLDRAKPTVS